MMTSWHGNAFLITGPLWGKSSSHRWIHLLDSTHRCSWWTPLTKAQRFGTLMLPLLLAQRSCSAHGRVASDCRRYPTQVSVMPVIMGWVLVWRVIATLDIEPKLHEHPLTSFDRCCVHNLTLWTYKKKESRLNLWNMPVPNMKQEVISEQNKIERKNNRQNLGDVQKHKQRQEIDRKFLSTILHLHTNCHFKNINLKVDHHTGSGSSTGPNAARQSPLRLYTKLTQPRSFSKHRPKSGPSYPLPWASGLPVAIQWQSSVPGT